MILDIIKKEFDRRMIEEGCQRIKQCCESLTEKELWHQANENTNSIANLIMHLSGNVRQYIISGIGSEKDMRERDLEFSNIKRKEIDVIVSELIKTVRQSSEVIHKLNLDELIESRKVQGFDETVLSIIIHVIEHFSYHVGQITYYTKATKNIDTGYYSGLDLNIT
ncbi:DUF1572 domain-containing protein [Saprospiraceae bacterium]|nr:DUF1572 domain-containing protein [Saprospiraceae bacterium]